MQWKRVWIIWRKFYIYKNDFRIKGQEDKFFEEVLSKLVILLGEEELCGNNDGFLDV